MSINREVLVCSVIGAVGLTATAAGLCLLTRKVYKVLKAVQNVINACVCMYACLPIEIFHQPL